YITRLANKGVGVRLLAALAGHSHISTTQRYIDVNSEQLSEAVKLL
ncbi:tyrosine-type recombinase/integrase, partial [Planktomarina temperata]|nr:tyrosine-type recombinase/integrase [Planktomarina temperata]